LAKQIYDYWFVQFDFPDENGKPYKSSGGKMVWNEDLKREIPEDWEVKRLENVIKVNRGGSPRPIDEFLSDKGLHWLKISDATVSSSPFILDTKEFIIEEGLNKTVMIKAGSLVLSNSATPGMPRILDIDTCIHDGWLYFSKSELSNEFLYLFFLKMRENIVKYANGSIFLNLKTDVVKDFKIILPSYEILKLFDNIIKPNFSQILNIEREIKKLTDLRDRLLPLLMNGQVTLNSYLSHD
jgi:type I restriction enzyme S subunit